MTIIKWCCVALTLIFILGVIVLTTPPHASASADEAHIHQYHASAEQDEWMRSLIRPDTGTSCCNLNDCSPTDAEWRGGQWWAVYKGAWRAIPPEKVLSKPLSMDGEAWLCAMERTIFCFVPPLNSY
jgi:hypothetical protein